MAMKYYLSYGIPSKEGMPAQPVMQVMAYDDANGIRYRIYYNNFFRKDK